MPAVRPPRASFQRRFVALSTLLWTFAIGSWNRARCTLDPAMPASLQQLTFPIRSEYLSQSVAIEELLYSHRSPFQQIDILQTVAYGRILLLDGHVQLSTLDEHVYHESLVQIPMLNIDHPRTALVVGGGDGGVLKELCKHSTIQAVDMAEIDVEVVKASRQYLPTVSAGAFDDPRVHVHITDAFAFVNTTKTRYDIIVVDSTDVYENEEGELSERLFTEEFYRELLSLMNPGGIVVTQADNMVFCPYSLREIKSMFAAVFPTVGDYFSVIPSFGGFSAFCWGSKGAEISPSFDGVKTKGIDMRYLTPQAYDFSLSKLGM